jgi:hypothetical protein
MKAKSSNRHPAVTMLHALLIVFVIVASIVSMGDPACRDRTNHLAFDGICVGMVIAAVRLTHILGKPMRIGQSAWSWWCLIRITTGVEVKYGLIGGFLFGITIGFFECVIL